MRSLELAVKYLAGDRLQGTAAERAALGVAEVTAPDATGFKELSTRVEATSGTTSLQEITSLPAKDNLMFIWWGTQADTNSRDPRFGFNGDGKGLNSSSTNYSTRYQSNWTTTSGGDGGNNEATVLHSHFHKGFAVGWIRNISSEEKPWWALAMGDDKDAGNSITVNATNSGVWKNSSDSISSMWCDRVGTSTGYDIGSPHGLIMLGADNNESTASQTGVADTPFWQELALGTQSNASPQNTLNTGTFAAKKFLWVQVHVICGISGGVEPRITVNGSGITGTTYSTKYNANYSNGGATDYASDDIRCSINGSEGDCFMNFYILNLSTRQKCLLGETAHSTSNDDATDAPQSVEFAAKVATNSQITSIEIMDHNGAARIAQNSTIRVWGAD